MIFTCKRGVIRTCSPLRFKSMLACIRKGRPNEEDLKNAESFAENLKK
jgi:hypothetical protein